MLHLAQEMRVPFVTIAVIGIVVFLGGFRLARRTGGRAVKHARTWCIIYRIDEDAVVIVHVFSKKSRKTPKAVTDPGRDCAGHREGRLRRAHSSKR